MLVTSVPRALALGARVFADCRVERITRAGTGVLERPGVTRRPPGGQQAAALTVRAPDAGDGAGRMPRRPSLLARSGLRSASGHSGPQPVAAPKHDGDRVLRPGRHRLAGGAQPSRSASSPLRDMLSRANLTPPAAGRDLPAYGGGALGELVADYNHIVTAGPVVRTPGPGGSGQCPASGAQVFYRLTDHDAGRVARGVELTAEALFAAGARRVLLPFDGAPVVRGPDELRRLLARPVPKRSLQLFSIHLMGTARMSEDPRRGVTGSFGEVHGVPGLIVADASLFPGPIGINPMETVVALAMRNARRLVERRDGYRL